MTAWAVIENSQGERHVVPQNDLHQHANSTKCWCNPTDDEGVFVHHSADMREVTE